MFVVPICTTCNGTVIRMLTEPIQLFNRKLATRQLTTPSTPQSRSFLGSYRQHRRTMSDDTTLELSAQCSDRNRIITRPIFRLRIRKPNHTPVLSSSLPVNEVDVT